MKPSSMSIPPGPTDRKKSARAYGSTIACNDASASFSSNAGIGLTLFLPAAPRKLPMTATSGLKIFESALTFPYTGSAPSGPPTPVAPAGTSTRVG